MIYRILFLSAPILILFFLQPSLALSKTYNGTLSKIQGYAVPHTGNKKYAKKDIIKLMGAFATLDIPTAQPISLKFEYTTFDKLYMGIAIVNYSGDDKDVTVTFELSGPRGGIETEDVTVPAASTYYAYIYDTLGRPGFYTFRGSVKDVGTSKITLFFTEE